jgi:hypothetical protein
LLVDLGRVHLAEPGRSFVEAVLQEQHGGEAEPLGIGEGRAEAEEVEEGVVLGAELVIQDDTVAPELMGPGIDQRAVFQPLERLLFDGIDGQNRGIERFLRQVALGGEVIPQDGEIVVEQAVAEDGFLIVFPAAQEGREFVVEGAVLETPGDAVELGLVQVVLVKISEDFLRSALLAEVIPGGFVERRLCRRG